MTGDLTRWNRAGLSRFRYVDANAATHLEALRVALADRFADWRRIRDEAPPDETVAERTARLLAQYHDARRDWAWETTRAFARALHVLTEHIDAFANEGYLRTAMQWQSVRRLAAMVGYAPAPASSATAPLVLMAKSEVRNATVKRGFAVKHVPAGAPPVIFETLEDLAMAHGLNALRLAGWNENPRRLSRGQVLEGASGKPVWPIPKDAKVSAGGLAVLAKDGTDAAIPAIVAAVAPDGATLDIAAPSAVLPGTTFDDAFATPRELTVGTALLQVAPSQILTPLLNGEGVVRVAAPQTLVAGDVVAWKSGTLVRFATVLEADAGGVRLQGASDVEPMPPESTRLFRAASIPLAQFTANNSEWRLPTGDVVPRSADFRVTFAEPAGRLAPGLAEDALDIEEPLLADGSTRAGYSKLRAAALAGARRIWFADPARDAPVATVGADLPATTLAFAGKPPALASGDFVVLQTRSGHAVAKIGRIETDASGYRLVFAAALGGGGVIAVHGVFAATLRPQGHDADPTPLGAHERELRLAPGAEWPGLLQRGRRLVLASASDAFLAFAARIDSFGPEPWTLRIDRALPVDVAIGRGDLIVHANVAEAGHGETKPMRVLGSGDASATNQRFVIDADDVSHVRDAAMPGGVRADILVEVERELYRQVASLRDAGPADPHYVARITETGVLELEFGDGRYGRRLPSGSNNVLASIRRGSGLAGNLPAGALADTVKKHPAVASFLQPIAAAGGDDRETVDRIRQNAPGRLAAMDRAISVADYRRLAQRFQGVWHAAAFDEPSYRRSREAVRVVIVPAGGGPLGDLADHIRAFLLANGLPSIDVAIVPFAALPVEIAVTARVESARFDPLEVEGRLRAAVLAAFDLRRRGPGQPVYRSEVTRVVENTDGVTNSDVALFASVPPTAEPDWDHAARGDDGGIWAVFPKDHQVIYGADPARIAVTLAEATI